MHKFHGDILLGGAALREVDGLLDEEQVDDSHCSGRFEVDVNQESLVEIGRPYLLLLDDGRTAHVVVKEVEQDGDHATLIVRFGPKTA